MYQQFFQFRRLPFQSTPDPHFFFFTARHEEAFNQALYTVRERKGFMALTGEVGTGKTTLSRLLIEQLGPRVKSSLVFNPNLTTVELLQSINHDFRVNDQSYSKKILTDDLNQFLMERLVEGDNAALIIDEAQTLSVECLEEIRLLSNLETPRAKLLQILLIGQPELMDKLELPQLRQLNQRIVVRAHLTPLAPQEVADYIQYRLWRAGGREAVHFEPAALELVNRYSGGVPRLINALCDRALLAAYVRGTRLISGLVMSQAIGELTPILPVTEPPPAYLTQERPIPPARSRPDPMLRVAVIGLVSLLAGLGAMWWNAGSIDQRFPTALLAREQSGPFLPPATELLPAPDADFTPPPAAAVVPPVSGMPAAPAPTVNSSPMTVPGPSVAPESFTGPHHDPLHPAPAPVQPAPALPASAEPSQTPPPAMPPAAAPTVLLPPDLVTEPFAPLTNPLIAKVRIPLLPMEVMTPSHRLQTGEFPAAPEAPVLPAPSAAVMPEGLPLELKTDHLHTGTAHTEVARTGEADAIAPSAAPVWFVDGDDVIRIGPAGSPALLERAALLMLLRQWGAVPDWPPTRPDGSSSADPSALAREHRLELVQFPLSGRDLLRLDYPAIVMRKSDKPGQPPRPVVISRTIGGRAVLLDPVSGFLSRPVEMLDQEFTGTVRLYWRPLNGWRWPGPIDGNDPVVRWLQHQLREQRLYQGRVDGFVGPETEEALRRLAGERGLTVTSADPLIDLLISQLLAPAGFPRLSLPAFTPSGGRERTGVGQLRVPQAPAG